MNGVISWNGVRSDSFGIIVEKYPSRTKPNRKITAYSIPGRNGDIIMPQDAWDNVEQKYDLILGDGENYSATEILDEVTGWLCGPSGYCELWDDFDPGHYRRAYIKGAYTLDPVAIGRAGRVTVTFVCDPRRFLLTEQRSTTISSSPGTIYNETAFKAKPLIKVNRSGSSAATVTIGSTIFSITSIPSGGLWIDCEAMVCYNSNNVNQNSIVSSSTSEFAVLEPGNNTIAFTGGASSLEITPNFFEI